MMYSSEKEISETEFYYTFNATNNIFVLFKYLITYPLVFNSLICLQNKQKLYS